MKAQTIQRRSTQEIKGLLESANKDFDLVVNSALNDYLSKIFHVCPFVDDLCIGINKQCIGCKNSSVKIYSNSLCESRII
jgi:hypothetical protein